MLTRPTKGVGARIRKARLAKGLTRRELVSALGTYYPVVCNWENGRVTPSEPYLRRIADVTGADLEWLRHGEHHTKVRAEGAPERGSDATDSN